jgi:hypothetical protein
VLPLPTNTRLCRHYLRQLPLSMRKTNLARLLAQPTDGLFVAPLEQGEIGPDLFEQGAGSGWRAGVEAP